MNSSFPIPNVFPCRRTPPVKPPSLSPTYSYITSWWAWGKEVALHILPCFLLLGVSPPAESPGEACSKLDGVGLCGGAGSARSGVGMAFWSWIGRSTGHILQPYQNKRSYFRLICPISVYFSTSSDLNRGRGVLTIRLPWTPKWITRGDLALPQLIKDGIATEQKRVRRQAKETVRPKDAEECKMSLKNKVFQVKNDEGWSLTMDRTMEQLMKGLEDKISVF